MFFLVDKVFIKTLKKNIWIYTLNMNKKTKIFFVLAFVVTQFFSINISYAYTCPNYEFQKDLLKGSIDEDVRVMQEILNSDKRTLVTQTGLGSKGNETPKFGVATREALKRFQALFIEYIGIADGKFNEKTRIVMNKVCQSPFFKGKGGNPYDITNTKETIPPVVGIAAPQSASIDTPFRAYIGASEAIKLPTLNGLMITNATAGDVRKVSSTTYSFLVTPNQDATENISLQFEADTIEDLAGNKNELASNEWVVQLTGISTSSNATTSVDLSILDSIISNLPTATNTDCSKVSSVSYSDYTNPCYGKTPFTQDQQQQNQEQKDNSMMQMLQGLMQGLMKALGGGGSQTGGKVGGDAACGCTGMPTASYMPIGPGIAGRQITLGVSGMGGNYVGRQLPPPGICGVRPRSGPKDMCSGIPGPHNASCCGILLDVTMQPVTGTLAPSPTGMRSGI
jgi:hypothetical protein